MEKKRKRKPLSRPEDFFGRVIQKDPAATDDEDEEEGSKEEEEKKEDKNKRATKYH